MLTLLVALCAVGFSQKLFQQFLSPAWGPLAAALVFLLAYVAGGRWIERRRIYELAPRPAAGEFLGGLFTGCMLFATVMGVLWLAKAYDVTGVAPPQGIGPAVALAVMAGVVEELIFRGVLFRLSETIVGTWGGLLFTSALFGLAHLGNRGATWTSGLAIMLEAGVLLGAAYVATERLWLPIGLHIAWNFTEGSVFGMSVSGNSLGAGMVQGSLHGPVLLTGGQFGPEASIVAVVLCFFVALLFLRKGWHSSHIVPPAWTQLRAAAKLAEALQAHGLGASEPAPQPAATGPLGLGGPFR